MNWCRIEIISGKGRCKVSLVLIEFKVENKHLLQLYRIGRLWLHLGVNDGSIHKF